MKYLVHSVTDVITNSSTTIYTRVAEGAIEMMNKLIYDLTGEATDQRFTIRATSLLEGNPDWLDDQRWEYMRDLPVREPFRSALHSPVVADLEEEAQEKLFSHLKENNPPWWFDWVELGVSEEEMEFGDTYIEVKALNESDAGAAEVLSNLHKLFEAVETYG